jgi:hypothetical protein
MRLGKKQELFSKLMAEHILWLYSKGYKVRGGDWFRDPRVHGAVGEKKAYGKAYSMHKDKCAFDINLFKNGKYLTKTEDHLESGRKWESRHPLCAWGGRFNDGNHYSLTHQGRK